MIDTKVLTKLLNIPIVRMPVAQLLMPGSCDLGVGLMGPLRINAQCILIFSAFLKEGYNH